MSEVLNTVAAAGTGQAALTIRQTIARGTELLREAGIDDCQIDAMRLYMHISGLDRTHLILAYRDQVSAEMQADYDALLARRAAGEPLQYITGSQDFMGLPFHVEPGVLIPRPETELLVEQALSLLEQNHSTGIDPVPLEVLDIGTGSGAIGVSVARLSNVPVHLTCVDISPDALRIAQGNAESLGLCVAGQPADNLTQTAGDPLEAASTSPDGGNCIEFLHSDLMSAVEGRKFDMILSNPPYISDEEIRGLATEVRDHEPNLALSGGEDGLDIYRRLAPQVAEAIKPGGEVLFEIGWDQSIAVQKLLRETGAFAEVGGRKDLAGLDRIVWAKAK